MESRPSALTAMNNKKRKILWLSHFVIYPPHGGARIRSYHLFRELCKEFDVTLIMLDPRGKRFVGRDVNREIQELAKLATSVTYLPLRLNSTFIGKVYFLLASLVSQTPVTVKMLARSRYRRLIAKIARNSPFSAVHIDNIELCYYLPACDTLPIVINHHNIESQLLKREAEHKTNPLLRYYFQLQGTRLAETERHFTPKARINFAVSELDKRQFEKLYPSAKFEVIRNGVDLHYFYYTNERLSRPATTLIWVGSMHWFPNQDATTFFLEKIWPDLSLRRPEIRLLLVGQSPPELARSVINSDRIDTPGYVDDARLYLRQGDIYIVPIRVGSGTRLKILDAFASGIPLVSTSIGCEGLEVVDREHLLIRDKPEDFIKGIVELLDSAEMRSHLASAGRRFVEENYSWDSIGEKLRSCYRTLTDE